MRKALIACARSCRLRWCRRGFIRWLWAVAVCKLVRMPQSCWSQQCRRGLLRSIPGSECADGRLRLRLLTEAVQALLLQPSSEATALLPPPQLGSSSALHPCSARAHGMQAIRRSAERAFTELGLRDCAHFDGFALFGADELLQYTAARHAERQVRFLAVDDFVVLVTSLLILTLAWASCRRMWWGGLPGSTPCLGCAVWLDCSAVAQRSSWRAGRAPGAHASSHQRLPACFMPCRCTHLRSPEPASCNIDAIHVR